MGLTARAKFTLQMVVSAGVGMLLYQLSLSNDYSTALLFPFFKEIRPELALWFVPLAMLVLVGASNAVNLTDGLDGLAIGTVLIAGATFVVLTYVTGHAQFSAYLDLIHTPRIWELTIFGGSLVGASLGFLWFNCYPAQMFMGDVGSLALGSAIGTIALLIKQELLLVLVGGRVRARGGVGDRSGGLVQADGQAGVPHGAAASSLRARGLERAEDHHSILDPGDHVRPGEPDDAEAEMREDSPRTT